MSEAKKYKINIELVPNQGYVLMSVAEGKRSPLRTFKAELEITDDPTERTYVALNDCNQSMTGISMDIPVNYPVEGEYRTQESFDAVIRQHVLDALDEYLFKVTTVLERELSLEILETSKSIRLYDFYPLVVKFQTEEL